MSLILTGLSHHTAPDNVRACFAYDEESMLKLLKAVKLEPHIEEALVLSTCNRTEIYAYCDKDEYDAESLEAVKKHAVSAASAGFICNLNEYILMFRGESAVRHLFQVSAGLDSMLIGEDQILGQVRQAYDFACSAGMCGRYFKTLFRYAFTAAKRVKTDTGLSKTPVSLATLAVKAGEEALSGLDEKNILLIGASGSIGSVVLKNLLSHSPAKIWVTRRRHNIEVSPRQRKCMEIIPYEERYKYMDAADLIISATGSPHYTITKDRILTSCKDRKRIFVDMANPPDIDKDIEKIPQSVLYNLNSLKKLAGENNKRKLHEALAADIIIEEYVGEFIKRMLFQMNFDSLSDCAREFSEEAAVCGSGEAFRHLLYRLRDGMDFRAFESLIRAMKTGSAESDTERQGGKYV